MLLSEVYKNTLVCGVCKSEDHTFKHEQTSNVRADKYVVCSNCGHEAWHSACDHSQPLWAAHWTSHMCDIHLEPKIIEY